MLAYNAVILDIGTVYSDVGKIAFDIVIVKNTAGNRSGFQIILAEIASRIFICFISDSYYTYFLPTVQMKNSPVLAAKFCSK